jgi:hypothetical protein
MTSDMTFAQFAQLTGVDPGNLRDFITMTLVLGLAVLQLLNYLKKSKADKAEILTVSSDGVPVPLTFHPREYVDRILCSTTHGQTDHRIKRLEISESAIRTELADIRREMKADRDMSQRQLLDEISKVQMRVDQVLVAVSELRGARDAERGS